MQKYVNVCIIQLYTNIFCNITNESTAEYLPFNYKIRDILSNKLELIIWTSPISTLNSYQFFLTFDCKLFSVYLEK